MNKQSTSSLLMIRPIAFRFNEETAVNNYYQKVIHGISPQKIQLKALKEFDDFVKKLRLNGVEVVVIEDTISPSTPDSIFPNNWISFHSDGRIALYPMCAKNRRLERRMDIISTLRDKFHFHLLETVDFSSYEEKEMYLEGTGSMLLDRQNKIAYAALSSRTDSKVLDDFCETFGYTAHTFVSNQTVGSDRLPIYHTNVMMSLAENFVVLCADSIDNSLDRDKLIYKLRSTGKEIIFITEFQKHRFAGNMLQVINKYGHSFLVMSNSAYLSLERFQIEKIKRHSTILSSSLDTIEACGGGSARCMMAEIFLPKNKDHL